MDEMERKPEAGTVMQENPADSGNPPEAGTCVVGKTQLQRHIGLGSSPGPPLPDTGQQTGPFHEPCFPKGNSRVLEGFHESMPSWSLEGPSELPRPEPLTYWRLGPYLLLFLPPLLSLSFSAARRTPHCMLASPPKVPRCTLLNTSTRYELLCERPFWVIHFPTLS